jgi:hypothetical protein
MNDRVRSFVYSVTMARGTPPTLDETANQFRVSVPEMQSTFRELADAHMLVLQKTSGEILMANPFSAVPTAFQVELDDFTCFGNCIWDAMGIAAMKKADARINASCGDCGSAMKLEVQDGKIAGDDGLIHFAVPAARWWDDVVFN